MTLAETGQRINTCSASAQTRKGIKRTEQRGAEMQCPHYVPPALIMPCCTSGRAWGFVRKFPFVTLPG
eukprot:10312699-Heterocapsa_arctica.AAC.1